MTITAKFASTCPSCRTAIRPGQQVEWTKGSQARHVSCALIGGATAASKPAPRAKLGAGHGAAPSVRGYSSYCTATSTCRCYDCAS